MITDWRSYYNFLKDVESPQTEVKKDVNTAEEDKENSPKKGSNHKTGGIDMTQASKEMDDEARTAQEKKGSKGSAERSVVGFIRTQSVGTHPELLGQKEFSAVPLRAFANLGRAFNFFFLSLRYSTVMCKNNQLKEYLDSKDASRTHAAEQRNVVR
ncbi:unnamed protein product [Caenorhabditis auriculariae]|uniref:Uncharacterized protein n=1 Tax=Caenorhabditis auriculariae TaxID=2777116 RepID=A0A8S1HSB7_9PELO|nr:unnamed protein product [Caenorhabditis auriculariae]